MHSLIRRLIPFLLFWTPFLCAQQNDEAGALLVPFSIEDSLSADTLMKITSARAALQSGLPSVAANTFRNILQNPSLPENTRKLVILDLASAYLNASAPALAEEALKEYGDNPGSAYFLREGLIAAKRGNAAGIRISLAKINEEDLPIEDRGWFFLLQGMAADAESNYQDALSAYQKANQAATSQTQRASFILAREQTQLLSGQISEEQAAELLKNVERYRGRGLSYIYAKQYAIALDALGKSDQAAAFLQGQLQTLPSSEYEAVDELRLTLGLIAGTESGVGRNAVEQLVTEGRNRDIQEVALQLLVQGSSAEPASKQLRERLDEWIKGNKSMVMDALMLVRAQLSLEENDYTRADALARELLEKYPGSPLRPSALGVLADAAWSLKRYRTTADLAWQASQALGDSEKQAMLNVLTAEAYFMAGDYRNAAEAYANAIKQPPQEVPVGILMGQRILSEIQAGEPDGAEQLLDETARDPRFTPIDRWEAEWHLARAREAAGKEDEAFARIERELGSAQDQLPVELRVRMLWLQCKLSLAADMPQRTLELSRQLIGSLSGLSRELAAQIEASARLLEARANLRLERTDEALELLKSLRADFPNSNAAVYSYVNEASYYAEKRRFVDAQALLMQLADQFKDNVYAPYALYLAAVNAERRGQDVYYNEAYLILERIPKEYPDSEYVFLARLRQGDLLRRQNQFGAAQQIYEFLINHYPQHPGVLVATLSLAACHRAQAIPPDVSHYENAVAILERLYDLPGASVDLKAETAFQLGDLLAQRPASVNRAQTVWWTAVNQLLLDDRSAAQLGVKGRYWIARTLLRLGDSLAREEKLEEARNAYRMITEQKLPFSTLAQESLGRIGG